MESTMAISTVAGYRASQDYSRQRSGEPRKTELPKAASANAAKEGDAQSLAQGSRTGGSALSLSADAILVLSSIAPAQVSRSSYYERFFPTRDGFSAANLAAAVTDPSAQPFSENRSFAEVAESARTSLNAKYQLMNESGQPYETNSYEGIDSSSAFAELDRRALYAVASNEGGLFSEREQRIATSLMSRQQGLAMALYSGPTRLTGEFVHPSMVDRAQSLKSGIRFLDGVSSEEKAGSFAWAEQRATTQRGYETEMAGRGEVPEDIDTEHPLAKLIKAALEESEAGPDVAGRGNVESEADLLRQPWFHGFEDQLDRAVAQTRELFWRQQTGLGDSVKK
jgi:hypothetical protein